jgi:hypothetical protein
MPLRCRLASVRTGDPGDEGLPFVGRLDSVSLRLEERGDRRPINRWTQIHREPSPTPEVDTARSFSVATRRKTCRARGAPRLRRFHDRCQTQDVCVVYKFTAKCVRCDAEPQSELHRRVAPGNHNRVVASQSPEPLEDLAPTASAPRIWGGMTPSQWSAELRSQRRIETKLRRDRRPFHQHRSNPRRALCETKLIAPEECSDGVPTSRLLRRDRSRGEREQRNEKMQQRAISHSAPRYWSGNRHAILRRSLPGSTRTLGSLQRFRLGVSGKCSSAVDARKEHTNRHPSSGATRSASDVPSS